MGWKKARVTALIEEYGTVDKDENGKKSILFGVLFEKFGSGSDLFVGILMRSRRKAQYEFERKECSLKFMINCHQLEINNSFDRKSYEYG
jgi:hypothetical protein